MLITARAVGAPWSTALDNNAPVTVFAIDDDEVDIELLRRALKRARLNVALITAEDGAAALDMLEQGRVSKPYIMLLDINMPRLNGIELLARLREHPQHRDAVVFILTTSANPRDVKDAYRFNIAGYLVKSQMGEQFSKVVELLKSYQSVVLLPV